MKVVHLLVKNRAACGSRGELIRTRNPNKVTCKGCKRTVYQADAEVRWGKMPRSLKMKPGKWSNQRRDRDDS